MAEPKPDSIFEFADIMGITSPLANWLKPSGSGTAQGTSDLHVTQLKGPSMVCTGAIYEYRITGFNRFDFVLGEMVNKVKWGYSIDGSKVITRIFPRVSGVSGKHEILMKWHISRSLKGKHLKVHAWFEGQNSPSVTSAEILGYPFLFHKYKEKGLNEAGNRIANDMCYGDGVTRTAHFRYTRAEVEALGPEMQLTLQYSVSALWKQMRDMVTTLSAGELERVAMAMVERFEESNGSEFSNTILTKNVKAHQSTIKFIERIIHGIRDIIIMSKGNPVSLLDNDIYGDSEMYGRPQFSGLISDTIMGGLKICWNDTWAYEVHISKFDVINGNYFIQYRISLYDHFGLNIEDLSEHSSVYIQPGFRAWFALQHIHNFRPFIANVIIENSITIRI